MVGWINTGIVSRLINVKADIKLFTFNISRKKHWRFEDNKSDGTMTNKYGSIAIYKYSTTNK